MSKSDDDFTNILYMTIMFHYRHRFYTNLIIAAVLKNFIMFVLFAIQLLLRVYKVAAGVRRYLSIGT